MSEHHRERLIGLRNGELFALEWNAVNLDKCVLVVRWQLQELRGLELKEPKTTAGKRVASLDPVAIEAARTSGFCHNRKHLQPLIDAQDQADSRSLR